MRWPWVARSTLEAVAGERDRLRDQVDTLLARYDRVDRAQAGLRETPPPAKRVEPMPQDVLDEVNRWESQATRDRLKEDARKAYHRLGSWDAVLAHLQGGG